MIVHNYTEKTGFYALFTMPNVVAKKSGRRGVCRANPALTDERFSGATMAENLITKPCSKCKRTLPIARFSTCKTNGGRHVARCNQCRSDDNLERKLGRALTDDEKAKRRRRFSGDTPQENASPRGWALWRKYRLTVSEYDKLLSKQGGVCALCGIDDPRGRYRKFHVDHCHETGRIRGLLCNPCNVALGNLGDTPAALWRAYQYVAATVDAISGEAA